MRKSDCITRWFAVLPAALLLLLAGCAEEEPAKGGGKPDAGGTPVTVVLDLSVSIADSYDALTRADGETETPGTAEESAVKSLTVFIVDVDEYGNEAMAAQYATFSFDWNGSGTGSPDLLKFDATTGLKHIYVGANLTIPQIAAFAGGNGNGVNEAYTARIGTDFDDYSEMMSEFIEDGGFTMFGRATAGGLEKIEISGVPDQTLELSVGLSRVVAKVLVVAETETRTAAQGGVQGVEYAKVGGSGNEDASQKSWIRLDDLHFMLNVTNRRTFLFPKTAEEGGKSVVLDPNYGFEDLIDFTDGVFDYKSEYHSRQFVRWVPHAWNTDKDWGMPVQKYDESRMPTAAGGPNEYRKGLYCLENTVGAIPADWAAAPELAGNERSVTYLATTYVLIAAKITPRWIITKLEQDPAVFPDGPGPYRAANEEEARALLPASNDDHDEHPAGTFYTPDLEHVYSYDGMKARIAHDEALPEDDPDKLTRENFLCYPEGWGYYFTYVDGMPDEANQGNSLKFSSERSSVLRNHYYILNVRKFGGRAFPGEGGVSSMDIEVKRFGWTDAGTGDITLKP